MHICRRCGGQYHASEVTIINLARVLGEERYGQALRVDTNHLTEEEKTLFCRTDAERTYCTGCYSACETLGHPIVECGVRHLARVS